MVDVWLPYGKTEVCARIPTRSFLGSIRPVEELGKPNVNAEIKRSVREPLGCKPLRDIVRPEHKVAIVMDDTTRPALSHLMIPSLLDELNDKGVQDQNITIIFGCGTHRAVTREEAIGLLGKDMFSRIKTASHDCKARDHVFMGKTEKYGTSVYLNRIFAEADVKILTGDICFHYFAGYGGGRKSVLPAVAGEETIQQNHIMFLNPQARTGMLKENPVHEDMVDAARLAKVDFILNVVVNIEGEVVKAFAGDLEKAFYEGTRLVDQMYRARVNRKADIVVVSAGGHPADVNLFQAYKGLHNALEVVKRGGVVILVAECPEGHGNQIFYEWMTKYGSFRAVEKAIKRNFVLGGHKAYYLLKAFQKVQVILVSSLPDYYAQNVFRLKTARAVNDALDEAFKIAGKKAKVWVIPHGNFTLPEIKESEQQASQNG